MSGLFSRFVCVVCLLIVHLTFTSAQRLFISKYIHGSTLNAIEIFNPSCVDISGDELRIGISVDGGPWETSTYLPITSTSQTIPALGVHSICNSASAGCTYVDAALVFDGNDAIGLFHNNILIDVLGEPEHYGSISSGWKVGGTASATVSKSLYRKGDVNEGQSVWHSPSQSSLYLSQWTVYVQDYTDTLGVSHAYTVSRELTCPSTLYRVSCGTTASGSLLAGAAGDSFQVVCPGSCLYQPTANIYGNNAPGYALNSYVCRSAIHAGGIVSLVGSASYSPDMTRGNIPTGAASEAIADGAESIYMSSYKSDIFVLIDGQSAVSGADFQAQLTWVTSLLSRLELRSDSSTEKVCLIEYSTSATVLAQLSADRGALLTATTGATQSSGATRDISAALTAVQTEASTRGREAVQKTVIVLTLGAAVANNPENTALLLKQDGFNVYVVSVDSDGSGSTATNQLIASGTEYHHNVLLIANLDTVIASLFTQFWYAHAVTDGSYYLNERALFTLTLNAGTQAITGAIANQLQSLSLPTAQATYSLAVLALEAVTCLNSCTSESQGLCDTRTGVCTCVDPFFGDDCSSINCETECFNGGTCDTVTGTCVCSDAARYYGDDCSLRTCTDYADCGGASKGRCDSKTGTCTCIYPYQGASCSEIACQDDCNGNGVCDTSTGVCNCYELFSGAYCSLKLCPSSCSGRGECDLSTGMCTCDANEITGHHGACEHIACPNACSSNGSCDTKTGLCTCDGGFIGSDCSIVLADWGA